MKSMKNILGVSCGAGVPLWAFRDHHILGNIEERSDFLISGKPKQFELNFGPSQPITEKPDIIIGHPKCGSSSMLALSRGKQFTSHKGEPSLELYFTNILKYSPDIFLLENLPKLLDSYSIKDIQSLFPIYNINSFITNMDSFGNSQTTRTRLIITGVRSYIPNAEQISLSLSKPFPVRKPQPTRFLLRGLPEDGNYREDLDELITLYAGKKLTWREIQVLWHYLYPKRHIPTPEENFNTAPGVYINWSKDKPLVARKSNRQFNPSGLPMTPRELCRIQGIPDSFKILPPGNGLQKKTAINKGRVVAGNTPPYEVALWFKKALENSHYL